jgi:hypothetical protein
MGLMDPVAVSLGEEAILGVAARLPRCDPGLPFALAGLTATTRIEVATSVALPIPAPTALWTASLLRFYMEVGARVASCQRPAQRFRALRQPLIP